MPENFFAMSGYAAYVWSAYGITFIILTGMISLSLYKHRKARKEEQKLMQVQKP